jgi:hypothetical protein
VNSAPCCARVQHLGFSTLKPHIAPANLAPISSRQSISHTSFPFAHIHGCVLNLTVISHLLFQALISRR